VRCRFLKFVPIALLALGLEAQSASAQNGERVRQWWAQRQAAQRQGVSREPATADRPNARAMAGLPPKWVEKLRDMPPEEQQKFLANSEQFKRLPPERQEQIRRNLERWNNLTPEQKEQAHAAEQAFERMTPEQRQYVRNTLLPKWQAMPVPRRQVIRRHLGMLGQMSPATQRAALNDPKFMQGLSPDEQSMLRELNSLRSPAPAEGSPQP
jgi:hypothetical protein